jgi:hypothetical protein
MRRLLATCAIAALATTGVALVASADPAPNNTSVTAVTMRAANTPTTAVTAVQPDAAASFKLLRTTPPTPMPADVIAGIGSPERFGRNPALARAIKTPTGTGWVIPGDGFLCIAIPDPVDGWGSTCLPTDVAAVRGLDIGLTAADGRTIETMLVPDDAPVEKVTGPVSTTPTLASAAVSRKRVTVGANGIASAHTNAPGSLRITRR